MSKTSCKDNYKKGQILAYCMYNITFKYTTLTGPVTGPLAPTPYGESTSKINYTTFLISLLEVLVVPAGIEKR